MFGPNRRYNEAERAEAKELLRSATDVDAKDTSDATALGPSTKTEARSALFPQGPDDQQGTSKRAKNRGSPSMRMPKSAAWS